MSAALRGLTPLMQEAFSRIGQDWGPYPAGVYVRTLEAMKKRGVIEERLHKDGLSSQWQYRRAANAKSDPHANGCPDAPGICECFSRRSAS